MVDRSQISGWRAKFAGYVRCVARVPLFSLTAIRFAAWVMWRSYYVTQTLGWRNKLLVPMYWTLALVFGRDVTRF